MITPILFLHGFPFNASSWENQLEYYQNKRIVLAPDLRGHGTGPKGQGPWMIADFVDDLHQLLIHAKIEKLVLCGLSMGGYIALEFIDRYPDMVQALVLCATRADADSNEAKDQRFKTIERLRSEGLIGFADDFSKQVLSEVKSKDARALKQLVEEMVLGNSAENLALVLGALASRKDHTSNLEKIVCPTLVVAGAEDKIINWKISQSMVAKIPNGQFIKVPHAGHLINIEQPEKFNSLLDAFLNNRLLTEKEMNNGHSDSPVTFQH